MKYNLATMNEAEKRVLWEELKKVPEIASLVVDFSVAFGKIAIEFEITKQP